jgi:hypothetical protein
MMSEEDPVSPSHTHTQINRSFDSNPCDIEMGRQNSQLLFPQIQPNQGHSDWTTDIEELIKRWKDQTEKLSHVHQESGYINRTRFYRIAIPSILVPFVMTLVSQNLYTGSNDPAHIVDGVMFMTTSILSAFGLFFNYGQTSEEHFQTSARYTDISNRIDSELARRRRFRSPSDVFITELKGRIESLGDNSPALPGNWC